MGAGHQGQKRDPRKSLLSPLPPQHRRKNPCTPKRRPEKGTTLRLTTSYALVLLIHQVEMPMRGYVLKDRIGAPGSAGERHEWTRRTKIIPEREGRDHLIEGNRPRVTSNAGKAKR